MTVMLKNNLDDTFGHRALHIYATKLQQQLPAVVNSISVLEASVLGFLQNGQHQAKDKIIGAGVYMSGALLVNQPKV